MKSIKLPLITLGVIVAVLLMFVFGFFGVRNNAISLEERVTTAQSEIKVQEKERADLIPNLVDCVKEYDKHEYETLMAVIAARGSNDDSVVKEVKEQIKVVAEAYPELKSSDNYKKLMDNLTTTENRIANARTNYNNIVTRYNTYVRHFPNSSILGMLGYENQNFTKLDFDVSDDAPTNLFGE